jgi:hypothetical protein
MAMGIPIVCNAGVGDTDLVIEKYEAGTVLTETNSAAYEAFSFPIGSFNKERSVIGAQEFYGLENGVNTYFSIYTQLKPENS